MNRVARVSASCKRAWTGMVAVAMFAATAGVAFAQDPPPTQQQQQQPPPQQQQQPEKPDQLKFSTSTPLILLNQIKAERATDFESAWTDIRAAFAKATAPDVKAFGESLSRLYKVDMPPAATQGGQAVIYIFQIESPSTSFSYNPVMILYETLHKGGTLTREEADAIYKKLDGTYISINPWPLVKVG